MLVLLSNFIVPTVNFHEVEIRCLIDRKRYRKRCLPARMWVHCMPKILRGIVLCHIWSKRHPFHLYLKNKSFKNRLCPDFLLLAVKYLCSIYSQSITDDMNAVLTTATILNELQRIRVLFDTTFSSCLHVFCNTSQIFEMIYNLWFPILLL